MEPPLVLEVQHSLVGVSIPVNNGINFPGFQFFLGGFRGKVDQLDVDAEMFEDVGAGSSHTTARQRTFTFLPAS